MSSEIVKLDDPQKVNDFIDKIEAFTNYLNAETDNIQTETMILGATFRDENYSALCKNIRFINTRLQNYVEAQRKILPELRRKIKEFEPYNKDVI